MQTELAIGLHSRGSSYGIPFHAPWWQIRPTGRENAPGRFGIQRTIQRTGPLSADGHPWPRVTCHLGFSRCSPRAHQLPCLRLLPFLDCGMGAVCLAGKTHACRGGPVHVGYEALRTGRNPSRTMDIQRVSPKVVPWTPITGKTPFVLTGGAWGHMPVTTGRCLRVTLQSSSQCPIYIYIYSII